MAGGWGARSICGPFRRISGVAVIAATVLMIGWGYLQPRAGLGGHAVESDAVLGKRPPFGAETFIHFYLGCRAALSGGNAYHPEDTLGPSEYAYRPLFHPPPSLLPFLAISQLDFRCATWINVAVNVVLLAVSGWFWGGVVSGTRRNWAACVLCACSWVLWLPCLNLLGTGQCSAWALLGVSAWLAYQSRGMPTVAGALLVAVLVKPHIAAVAVAFSLGYGCGMRRTRTVWAFAFCALVWCAITTCFVAEAWGDFLDFVRSSRPSSVQAATLAALASRALGGGFAAFWYGAWICAGLWGFVAGWTLGRRHLVSDDTHSGNGLACGLAMVCAVGLVLVPHAYSYDFVLLLPAFWTALTALVLQHRVPQALALLTWLTLSVVWFAAKVQSVDGETGLWWIPWVGLLITAQSIPLVSAPILYKRNPAGC